MISIVIIGAGNVANHLYKSFIKSNNVNIVQWYNRTLKTIEPFKNEVEVIDDLSLLKKCDVYILAVSDDAISDLSSKINLSNSFVIHTSGSASIYDIDKKHKRGVFYPLQTFTKNTEVNFKNIPICIETIDKKDLSKLKQLALALGSPYYKISTEQREYLHLSAVFINNFTNQLYRIAHEISDSKNIDFEIFKPLIAETATKVQQLSPYMAQTGPAIRNDKKTIKKHLKLIENEHHKVVYELLTKSIQLTHGRKKL